LENTVKTDFTKTHQVTEVADVAGIVADHSSNLSTGLSTGKILGTGPQRTVGRPAKSVSNHVRSKLGTWKELERSDKKIFEVSESI